MAYQIKLRTETIRENKTLNDNKFGAWAAFNIGTNPVEVYGVPIAPGEGLSSESICHLNPGDLWQEPIDIVITVGGVVRLLRSIPTPISR